MCVCTYIRFPSYDAIYIVKKQYKMIVENLVTDILDSGGFGMVVKYLVQYRIHSYFMVLKNPLSAITVSRVVVY